MSQLIPPDKAETILQLNGWSDGDMFPLGEGRMAEFNGRRNLFVVTARGGAVLGEVPFNALQRIRDGK